METVAELILCSAVIITALLFGGVAPVGYSLMEGLTFLALLVLAIRQTLCGRINLSLPFWPLLYFLWVLLELAPLPGQLVGLVSPYRHQEAQLLTARMTTSGWLTLSVDTHSTILSAFKLAAYLGAFALAAVGFDFGRRKSVFLQSLLLLGLFEGGYGIVQYLTASSMIFAYKNPFFGGSATGTFVNRNHFAGLLELVVPFAMAYAYYYFERGSENLRASIPRTSSGARPGSMAQTIFYFFLVALMVVAIIFSASRGGIFSIAFALVFLGFLGQVPAARKGWTMAVAVGLAVVTCYGLWVGLNPVLGRFEMVGQPGYLFAEGRIRIWNDTLRLVRDFPLTGTGLGTFGTAFRPYQTEFLTNLIDHAHNDFLEQIAETGMVGFALLWSPIAYLWVQMIRRFLSDERRFRRAVLLGCIGSTLALMIHSFTDFNLQIPANALIFACVLGIGYKASLMETREEAKNRPFPRTDIE